MIRDQDMICGIQLAHGLCRYPGHICPLHAPRPTLPEPELETFNDGELHKLGHMALRWAAAARVSPLQLNRFMRSVRIMQAMGEPPMELDRVLKETQLRALMIFGQYPRDAEEWALAAEVYGDDGMDLFDRAAALPRNREHALANGWVPRDPSILDREPPQSQW